MFVDVDADIDLVTVAELGNFRHLTRLRLGSQATSAGCEDGTNPENFLRSAKNNIDRGQVLAPVNPCIYEIRTTDLPSAFREQMKNGRTFSRMAKLLVMDGMILSR